MRRLWIVAVVVVALVGGCLADAATSVAPKDMKPGCHRDYYLWVIPVGMYCADLASPPS